jgi:hypothetical protein
MQFMRRTLLVLFGALLLLLLFATAFDFGIYRVIGAPGPVKATLSDSGIYNSVVGSALDQAKTSSNGTSQVSLLDPAIKKAAEDSFSPQVVQTSSEEVIDGIYNWLNGKTSQPDFSVDLRSQKNDFAEKVGQAAKVKAATLPVCTSVPATTDPFSATCLPPGVTPTQVGTQAKNDVLHGQGFLEHPNITADSIKSGSGHSVFASGKLKDAPKRYQLAKKTPYILMVLTILTILAIIFLSPTRRKGLRRVGFTLAFAGVSMLAFAWALNRVVAQNVIPQISLDNKVFESNVRILASDVTHSIDRNYWIFAIAYLSTGIVVLLLTLLGRGGRRGSQRSKAPAPKHDLGPIPKQAAPPPRPAPRPKRPPMIQG